MAEQLSLFDASPTKTQATINEKKKRNWENGFQRWSDNQSSSSDGKSFGCCGWGSMCDYCEDNSYGRPCVRALNEMCRENVIAIDYDNRNYEDIWSGNFGNDATTAERRMIMACKYETSNAFCGLKGCYAYRHKCYTEDMCKRHEPPTNADRIRAMSNEELTNWLARIPKLR